jgi:hypothetical protein
VPAVVAPGVQEGLVHRPSHEVSVHQLSDSHFLGSQAVVQRVEVVLEPEGVFGFCVSVRVSAQLAWLEVEGVGV